MRRLYQILSGALAQRKEARAYSWLRIRVRMEVKGVRRTIHRCMTLMHMIRLRIGDAEYDAGRVLYQSDSTSEGSWRAAGSRTTTRVSDSFVHVNKAK